MGFQSKITTGKRVKDVNIPKSSFGTGKYTSPTISNQSIANFTSGNPDNFFSTDGGDLSGSLSGGYNPSASRQSADAVMGKAFGTDTVSSAAKGALGLAGKIPILLAAWIPPLVTLMLSISFLLHQEGGE